MDKTGPSVSEIDEYLERFRFCSAEEILRYMGEARDFFDRYMTPGGRQFFAKQQEELTNYRIIPTPETIEE